MDFKKMADEYYEDTYEQTVIQRGKNSAQFF